MFPTFVFVKQHKHVGAFPDLCHACVYMCKCISIFMSIYIHIFCIFIHIHIPLYVARLGSGPIRVCHFES